MDILNFIVVLVAMAVPSLMIALSQASGDKKSLDVMAVLYGHERAKEMAKAAAQLPTLAIVGINATMIVLSTWVYVALLPALTWLEIVLILSSTVVLGIALARQVPSQIIVIALITSALGWFGPVLRLAA